MLKNSLWRRIFKSFIPPVARQVIRNKIKNFNKVNHTFDRLSKELKNELYEEYFMRDVLQLEKLINKSMDWNKS